jgi:glutamyl-tRNA reductase
MPRRKRNTVYSGLSPIEQEFVKLYSMDELQVIRGKTDEELEAVVSEASANIVRAKRELETNADYQRAMEILKPLREGYRDAVKWQDTKRRLALCILHNHGKVDIGEIDDED